MSIKEPTLPEIISNILLGLGMLIYNLMAVVGAITILLLILRTL